ncbi:hypothetical protein [Luteimonas mephitis]|uniref:hypothetical protein n=1 Tax=Luteimonas mephitis TaxID=83615 RepID=UPI00047BF74A|nr:hypothetical protein [Luteimonas mephitis]
MAATSVASDSVNPLVHGLQFGGHMVGITFQDQHPDDLASHLEEILDMTSASLRALRSQAEGASALRNELDPRDVANVVNGVELMVTLTQALSAEISYMRRSADLP